MNEKHKMAILRCSCQTSKFHHQVSISNELLRICTLCAILFFSTLLQWKSIYAKTFQLSNFKTRLDGEVCSSDFNMQNGNSARDGRCLWCWLTHCHIVRFASFLRWFRLWRVDSSPVFCSEQWHTDTQHRKDMLHTTVATEKETYVTYYFSALKFKHEMQCFIAITNTEKRLESTKRSGEFLTNFEVTRYCIDCLVWILKQNDFKRRDYRRE